MPSGVERALVTGATGGIGSFLARRLAASGAELVVFRREGSDAGVLEGVARREVLGDIGDPRAWEQALEGCSAVYHLAACVSLLGRDAAQRERANVEAVRVLRNVLLGRKERPRLVFCSTVGAVGVSSGPADVLDEEAVFNGGHIDYFRTKRIGERLVLERAGEELDCVVVCPATVLGARMRPAQKKAFLAAAAGRSWFVPPGGSCFVHVDDVVEGMLSARERGRCGERYILGGDNRTFAGYLGLVSRWAGVPAPSIPVPGFLLPPAGWMIEKLGGAMGADTGRLAAGFAYYSSEKARRELGYRHLPLEDVVARVGEACGK